jgi:acyl-coenzyme A synthetase/AMP-(fatty) acid ligase
VQSRAVLLRGDRASRSPGAIGKPVPGHRVVVVRDDGTPAAPASSGQIAVLRPDPVMFLGYWNNPAATGPSSSATG